MVCCTSLLRQSPCFVNGSDADVVSREVLPTLVDKGPSSTMSCGSCSCHVDVMVYLCCCSSALGCAVQPTVLDEQPWLSIAELKLQL